MSIQSLLRTSLVSLVCCAMFATTCTAQGSNQFGQGATGGMGQGGQSAFGAGGQAGRGQSRGGGAGFGQNAFGGAAGGSAFGGGGFGGTGPQAVGNNQIGGGQTGVGPQGGYLGSNAAQTQNFFRNMNGGQRRTAMFDFMIENLNDMRETRGRDGRDSAPSVRVKLRPAFETPLGTMRQVSADLQSRLASSVGDLGVTDSRITMDGRTLTLEGKVPSEHQRALVEKMISLEPGVTSIDNRLTVEAPLPPQD